MDTCVNCKEFKAATNDNLCISCFEYQYAKKRRELSKVLNIGKLLLLTDIGHNPGITFVQLKKNFNSDGSLATQLYSLEKKQLITVVKPVYNKIPRTSYYLTVEGTRLLKNFINLYQDISLKKIPNEGERKQRGEQILYDRLYHMLERLQEPSNMYELTIIMRSSYASIEPFVTKQLQLGNITRMIHNPNKYILTEKGKRVLYLIKELNKFITKWESNIIIPNERAGRK